MELKRLIDTNVIFEYWFHAAAYLPMKDYRYSLPQMLNIKSNDKHYYNADPIVMEFVMDTIRQDGPKTSRDFENLNNKNRKWYDWKPTKVALERLFLQGDLMITSRHGMIKTYDLTERVLPSSVETALPNLYELAHHLVMMHLRSFGVTSVQQVTYLRPGVQLKNKVIQVFNELIESKMEISQYDIDKKLYFVLSDYLLLLDKPSQPTLHILSPFDNSVIHRSRLKSLYDFDFKLECYLPEVKRVFGYFSLPILWNNEFIGRMDCKAHRVEKHFEIKHLHIENNIIDFELWLDCFTNTLHQFVKFNGCDTLSFSNISPHKNSEIINKSSLNK